MLRILIVSVALVGCPGLVQGQGFSILSGRNHPELRWQVVETAHFRIVYPERLSGIEAEAAAIAEAGYSALSSNLELDFDRRIDIFLSDEDEIVNGFAVPFGTGHTNIWVHVPEFARTKTGSEKWLRSVIPHEIAHIFHYQKVLDRPRWTTFLFGNPLPRFWTEGIAQYQTENWTALRGDQWLRTAVLEDRLSYDDGRSLWNGRLLYAVGHAQVRYLADRYGDSTLVEILAHRRPALFGLLRVHDVEAAFLEVTGASYRDFYDDWRRHVNIYYNTLASGMENVDSLRVDPIDLPGEYYFDVSYSPDTSLIAVLSLESIRRPVRRLQVVDRRTGDVSVVAEGTILSPVAWSPDSRRLAYARLHRGRYGSLLRDLYVVDADGDNRQQITFDRRAGSPAFSPDGRALAFTASDAGTENIYVHDLATNSTRPLTRFDGDVQVSSLRWHPEGEELLFDRFGHSGRRDVVVLDLASGTPSSLTDGRHDDRDPIYSPDAKRIAYTSLRDDVPNVFVYDRTTNRHERVTHLATGSSVMDWLPADSLYPSGSLIVSTSATKSSDEAYRIDASRRAAESDARVPVPYSRWTEHRPPTTIPESVVPDEDLIAQRFRYAPARNLRHVMSLALPYAQVAGGGQSGVDWGIAGLTSWIEPLGKHAIVAGGSISFRDPIGNTYALASYVNNQWFPTLSLNAYHLPGAARMYGDDLLVEAHGGGDITMAWPLDWFDHPYSSHTMSVRLRVVDVEALTPDSFESTAVPAPEEGQQADVRVSLTWRKQQPYWNNVIHPLDGLGVRLQVSAAARVLGTDTEFVRGDVSAYGVFPAVGRHRLFVYGRAQLQTGAPFSQNYVGLSRHDAVRLPLPSDVPLLLGDSERVRGFRAYALGDGLLFGSAAYRIPLASSLETSLLGVASLGSLAGALFADAGIVWNRDARTRPVQRLGVGLELKNALQLGNRIRISHALGAAQPSVHLGSKRHYEVYYRIRTTLPF